MKVTKRDGRIVEFNSNKILNAIKLCMAETKTGVDDTLATKITNEITEELIEKKAMVTVEELQDKVENKLMDSPRKDAAKRYITASLKREYASENGTELNSILPKMSPLNPQYLTKKQSVFEKISLFVERFKGVGGEL